MAEESVDVDVTLTDGKRVHLFIEHAIGSLARPLSDAALEAKVRNLAEPLLAPERSTQLIAACRGLGAAPDVSALVSAARP